jgi:hypothetical protein
VRHSHAPRWDGRSAIHDRLIWWDKISQLVDSARSGSTTGGLIIIALSGLEGKVLMTGGA